ncbi:RluA family pseudouridine synthase [Acanthopleuribacter pedis]|uniref:RNA pseudouridine synthase n=1 Tax=Acanthopleuribacter pedis TaxID=442870 RepID=A0A8J7U3P8_9BACT|nr:RNA pseudouridine synthase [Acanthopleuribacter pedis]MBO1318989.1 RNA pseudouridine synthase [Acanthopleuribacter pedis]
MSRLHHIQRVFRGAPQPFHQVVTTLTGLSNDQARLIITMGGAYLGKHRCKDPERAIRAGQAVQIYFRLPLVYEPIAFESAWIHRREKGLIVADKPAGLPTQGRRDADYLAFYECLKTYCGGYVGLHHRLDQDTSGLMLFTRDKSWNKDVGRLFSEQRIHKTYLAVAQGVWPKDAGPRLRVDAPILGKRTATGTCQVVAPAGKPAQTEFTLLAQREGLLLLRAKPITGRTHQIRVHAAHLGLPLWGDGLYGAPRDGGSFLLHCAGLRWPKTGRVPAGAPWSAPNSPAWDTLPNPLRDAARAAQPDPDPEEPRC